MTQAIDVPANERGVIRLFALSMTDAEAKALKDNTAAINAALGTEVLPEFVEVFPLSDLDGVGILSYLNEGNAVPEEQLTPDRSKLEKLGGWVLIVFSQAFGDAAMTLDPQPALTLIGTYGETRTDYRATQTVTSEAAKPFTAPPETVKKKPSDAAMSGR
mmetsp:Transcript_18247/g.28791  ORF Transcript_18247/g.28791 Transcript_18247/m.28791 type:complete len:160 (-) Transcript_18247:10-489(-)